MTKVNSVTPFKALALFDYKIDCFLIMELWDGPPYGDGAITALWCTRDVNSPNGHRPVERLLIRTNPKDLLPNLKDGDNFAAFITIPNGGWHRFSKIPAPRWYYDGVYLL